MHSTNIVQVSIVILQW